MRRNFKWPMYLVLTLVAVVVIFVGLVAAQSAQLDDPAAAAAEPSPGAAQEELNGARDLAEFLEPIRKQYKLPALSAAAVKGGKTVALGAVGVRRAGGKEPVELGDKFHIGSCTKSMTSTLCAILVQQGKLKWDSTVAEVFADQADKIEPAFRGVTLTQLLNHRSGLQEDRNPDSIAVLMIRSLPGSLPEQRRKLAELALSQKPAAAPGAKHLYSNIGYTIAGAMCERVTGESWEDLVRKHIFQPLGMTSAGFGAPGTAAAVDEPWGHLVSGATWKPMAPGEFADNAPVLGPAGTVHCSLADWAKYAAFHVRGARGEEESLPADVFRQLHTPLPDDGTGYAFGWLVVERGWAGGKALTHAGSNRLWFAVIWLAPERNMAYMAATNVGNEMAFTACDAAIGKMIELAPKLGE